MTKRITISEAKKLGLISGKPEKRTATKKRLINQKQLTPSLQDVLFEACKKRFATCVDELANVVPGRKFRIDIAFEKERLAIEMDGWQWHGKHKEDFKRDRERQNLLTLQGWRILRFTAMDVRRNLAASLDLIEAALQMNFTHSLGINK